MPDENESGSEAGENTPEEQPIDSEDEMPTSDSEEVAEQRSGRSGNRKESGRVSEPKRRDGVTERDERVDSTHELRHSGPGPHVTLTIEGEYETVFERVEHPKSPQHREVDRIVENLEGTLLAVNGTGGGIRSEIYEAVDFELSDPWEIRKYLELLEMHDLISMQDDRWVPLDHSESSPTTDERR